MSFVGCSERLPPEGPRREAEGVENSFEQPNSDVGAARARPPCCSPVVQTRPRPGSCDTRPRPEHRTRWQFFRRGRRRARRCAGNHLASLNDAECVIAFADAVKIPFQIAVLSKIQSSTEAENWMPIENGRCGVGSNELWLLHRLPASCRCHQNPAWPQPIRSGKTREGQLIVVQISKRLQ
jgi:hypothetical protein